MMAETGVSKEVSKVAGIEEKCGLDMSSYQDLPKPDCNGTNHHNQANEIENSYVFVTGADGVPDDAVNNKDAVGDGLTVSPESKDVALEDQGAKLDPENENLDADRDALNERESGNVELSNGVPPVVNDSTLKHDTPLEDGESGQVSVADSLEENAGKTDIPEEVDSELQDVSREAEDEVKLEREVMKIAENVPPPISLDLVLESYPINNKEETLKEISGEYGELNISSLSIKGSGNANDDCEDHNLSIIETSETSERSKDMVVNVAECELQDVSMEAEEDVKLGREVVERAEPEAPPSTSLDLDLKSNTINNKEETLGDESGEKGDLNITSSNINNSDNANDECEDQVNLSTASEACQESEDVVVVEVVEYGLRDVGMEAVDNVQLERRVVEIAEHEVPPPTSLDLDLESYPINNREETLKEESGENGILNIIPSDIESSGNANDECEDKRNLSLTKSLEAYQGSEDVVVDAVACELQDVSVEDEDEDEVKLSRARGVVKTAEYEVLASTSSELDLGSYPINNKEETHKEETKATLSLAGSQNQQCYTALGNNGQGVLEQVDEATTVMTNTDCHVETVGSLVLEEKSTEDYLASHVENGVQHPDEPDKHLDDSGVSSETMLSEINAEDSVPTQSFPPSNADAPQTEIEISDVETTAVSSSPVDGPESQIVEKGLAGRDSWFRCTTNEASSGTDSTLDTVVLTEKEPTLLVAETHAETNVSGEKAKPADNVPETFDVKLEPEIHFQNLSTISNVERTGNVTVECITEVSYSSNVDKEGAAITVLEIEDVEEMGDQSDGAAGSAHENFLLQENESTGNSHSNNISVAPLEGSLVDGEAASIKTKTKPFNYLIRVPRFDDESLREQIRLAKLRVDEKTKLRDAIQVQIQEKRANSQIHGIDYEYAKGEGRSARKLVRSKRMEIDSLQSVINKAKNALSIEDIDSQIYNMEHMIQHETLPLKEEKQLIREIKQLKQLREQLSSNMGSQDEIREALEQREEVEGRVKILRKELDILKGEVLKAETIAAEAEKKYDDENKKVKELQAQFRAADDVRQAAYAQWQSLRKELSKKSKHFFKYKDDAALASNYAFTWDTEALYQLCINHVENFMELWNTNDEFRREYVKFNTRSTVRRFGTLDGRSLGPDEKPPVLPSFVDERVKMVSSPAKVDPASRIPTVELKQETTIENGTSEVKPVKKVTQHKNQNVSNKGPAIPVQVNGLDTVSGEDITDEVHEEPKKSRDEIESTRKTEEMRREEAEAKLKEQRRLEALAKANEAREKKKRKAEKLQMRAELKTQKEAEQKEKEREKRLRKKERKKASATDGNDINNCETAPSSESSVEISKDIVVKDTSLVTHKKSQKHWLFVKQSKAKTVPPPLRNRNKKRWQQWMWVIFTSIVIFIMFWLGNIGVFSNVHMKRRSPVY